jgi:hypothetical protein
LVGAAQELGAGWGQEAAVAEHDGDGGV